MVVNEGSAKDFQPRAFPAQRMDEGLDGMEGPEQLGRERWYESYVVQVAQVLREYRG